MRDYAKVEPKAWHGETFKGLRKRGTKPLLVGLYLVTSPSSNMLGLFAQPILYMAHETGLGEQGALEGLQQCVEAGFCSYDPDSEFVWVHEMARYQIAPELKATDLRCKGIQKDYDALPNNPFLGPFFDRYAEAFHMTSRREYVQPGQGSLLGPTQAPYQAPTKPRTGTGTGTGTGTNPSGSSAAKPARKPKGARTVPDDFTVTVEMQDWAEANSPLVDWRRETEKFRDWEFKHPRTDWPKVWRTWMRKAQEDAMLRGAAPRNGAAGADWTGSAH